MKFKLDENLGTVGREILLAAGHDVMTVAEQKLSGAPDETLLAICEWEDRVLVTLDHDFGEVLRFPPRRSAGIAVLELRGRISPTTIRSAVATLAAVLRTQSIRRKLWIVEPGRVRIHEEPDNRSAIEILRADPALASLHRSLDVYYGDPARDAAMDKLYARFLKRGQLAFDVGSHVGDRIGSFRRLGARVLALEPQPDCARVIREIYGHDRAVTLIEKACGPAAGRVTFHVNSANPTVSTVSGDFVRDAVGKAGWEGQVWDRTIEVPVTTLDEQIATFGVPAFMKIDVEGYEDQVLAGLSRAVPALSFEFTTIQRDVAYRCLERISGLDPRYRFNLALGESQKLDLAAPVTAEAMAAHIRALPHEANSGDVYAALAW